MPERAGPRGMTLLEVLIAVMLLGATAVLVFSAFAVALRAAALASGLHTATSLAEEALATLAAAPCGSSFHAQVPSDVELHGLRFHRRTTVQRVGSRLWELTVHVTWTQARRPRTVTLTTLRHVSAACDFVGQ
ncbi:MAG: type II secretion system protein [Armatimonadota bacterium]|nr:type II secretion system protein [Armatimonadota bacterium]